jgi:hypothetical protein
MKDGLSMIPVSSALDAEEEGVRWMYGDEMRRLLVLYFTLFIDSKFFSLIF